MSSTRLYLSWALVITLGLTVASYGPAAIVQAVIPDVVPAANKRGATSIFALTDTTTPAAVGTPICDNGTGAFTAGICSPGVNSAALQYSQTNVSFNTAATHSVIDPGSAGVGSATMPAGVLNSVGQVVYLRISGFITTGATPANNGNVEFVTKFGTSTVSDFVVALQTLPGSTTIPVDYWIQYITNSTGTSGTLHPNGRVLFSTGGTSIGSVLSFGVANTTPKTVNFTIALAVTMNAILSAGTNTWSLEQLTISYI